jgi:hypothetical protein
VQQRSTLDLVRPQTGSSQREVSTPERSLFYRRRVWGSIWIGE